MEKGPGEIHLAVEAVRARVAAAAERAGRNPSAVRIVAATKTVAAADIAEVVAAGVRDIGENRVQELVAKRAALNGTKGIRWHLLGHVQRNKARLAAENAAVVHSLDSERIALALARFGVSDASGVAADTATQNELRVLIEVDLTGVAGRTGLPEPEVVGTLDAARRLAGIDVVGLMTIAPPTQDPWDAAPYFRRLRVLRDRLEQEWEISLPELSMGMSDDFEFAIAEGATMVRIGRAIFGRRPDAAITYWRKL